MDEIEKDLHNIFWRMGESTMKTKEYWTSARVSPRIEETRTEYELGYYNTLSNGGFIINVLINEIYICEGTHDTHKEWFWIETDADLNIIKDVEYSTYDNKDRFEELEKFLKKKRLTFVTTPPIKRGDR